MSRREFCEYQLRRHTNTLAQIRLNALFAIHVLDNVPLGNDPMSRAMKADARYCIWYYKSARPMYEAWIAKDQAELRRPK